MENKRLINAMNAAHIGIKEIIDVTDVDPKTAQRWLKGRIPHLRHRWKVAELLKEREDYLWPLEKAETSPVHTSEIIAAYAHRSDVSSDAWLRLFAQAHQQIDMLANAMLFIPEQNSGLTALLQQKAATGCKVRIALADPRCEAIKLRDEEEGLDGTLPGRIKNCLYHFRDIHDCENIEICYHSTILYNSLFRGDNEMFVTPHLYALHGSHAPLIHMRRLHMNGVFNNFANHFEAVWRTTKPIT